MNRRNLLKATAAVFVPFLDIPNPYRKVAPPRLTPPIIEKPLSVRSHIFFCPEGRVKVYTWTDQIQFRQLEEDPNIIQIEGWIGGNWEAYMFIVRNNKMNGVQQDTRAGRMMFVDGRYIPFRPSNPPSKKPFVSYTRHECDADVFQVDIIDP